MKQSVKKIAVLLAAVLLCLCMLPAATAEGAEAPQAIAEPEAKTTIYIGGAASCLYYLT